MDSTSLQITNRKGNTLFTTIDFPTNQKASHIVIFAHCFTCNSNMTAVRNINRALNQNGFAVVRFDFTGLGKSSGEFENSHFEANVEDLIDVNEFISKEYFEPSMIIGHSLGGAAAIVSASKLSNIKAVCTIGAPADVEHTTKHFKSQLVALERDGRTTVTIGGRDFTVNKDFVKGFMAYDMPSIIKSLHKPILILHSPIDEIVGINNAHDIYQNAMHPKSFISLDQADHLLSNKEDSIYVGSVISAWVRKYLPKKEKKHDNPEEHQLVASLNVLEDNFTTVIHTSDHGLLADEPVSVGGENLGLAPYELVTAGLAACTAMTINLYAKRKKWDLHDIKVFLSHSKIDHVENGKTIKLDLFSKELVFTGNLDVDQRERLREIAAKCPVHKTLSLASKVETKLRD